MQAPASSATMAPTSAAKSKKVKKEKKEVRSRLRALIKARQESGEPLIGLDLNEVCA